MLAQLRAAEAALLASPSRKTSKSEDRRAGSGGKARLREMERKLPEGVSDEMASRKGGGGGLRQVRFGGETRGSEAYFAAANMTGLGQRGNKESKARREGQNMRARH